jgi:hypothetical protein
MEVASCRSTRRRLRPSASILGGRASTGAPPETRGPVRDGGRPRQWAHLTGQGREVESVRESNLNLVAQVPSPRSRSVYPSVFWAPAVLGVFGVAGRSYPAAKVEMHQALRRDWPDRPAPTNPHGEPSRRAPALAVRLWMSMALARELCRLDRGATRVCRSRSLVTCERRCQRLWAAAIPPASKTLFLPY